MMSKKAQVIQFFLLIGLIVGGLSNNTTLVEAKTETPEYKGFLSHYQKKDYSQNFVRDYEQQIKIKQGETVETIVTVDRAGLYFLSLDYAIENESILPTQISLKVNDAVPYEELSNLQFRQDWQPKAEVKKDRYGNEIAPEVNATKKVQQSFLYDVNGYLNEPLAIALNAGENKLTFASKEGEITIKKLSLLSQNKISQFSIPEDPAENVKGTQQIIIEGEKSTSQNSSSIRPAGAFDTNLTPYNSSKRVLNYLDGASFSKARDKVTYNVTAPEKGYYYLTLNYRQDSRVDFPIYMNVFINGEISTQSLAAQPLPYTATFNTYTLLNQTTGEQLPIYLNAGENEVTLELVVSPVGGVLNRVSQMIKEIQSLSLEIDNLLGSNVDKNRDIDLEKYLPGIKDQLKGWQKELLGLEKEIQELAQTKKTPGAYNQLVTARKQFESLLKEPRKLANRVNELSKDSGSITANLATLLQEANNNGVSIDQLTFHQEKDNKKKSFALLSKITNSVKRFVHSFQEQDYTVGNKSDDESIQVWVNRPRQYVELMQQMIDQDFTPKTGIKVDLSLMPDANKLILSNASGTAPDVALGVNYAMPFDMGIREALEDFSHFDGFEELMAEYPEKLLTPATIGTKHYAIPETMNFYVLMYRTDILNSLGLTIPDTMKELVEMLPALNQRGMSAFYPTATLGTSFKIFPWTMPVVYQSGGEFYTEDILDSGLNKDETVEGLKNLTNLFTIYNMPKDVPSFYQQFRDGSIPIGVTDFGNYNLILNAAPEISNVWELALMPGYENEQGEVERWSSGGAESAIMFKSSKNKDNAWKYLQWWLSSETQTDFGTKLQMSLGKEYMWNTANINAFKELPWPSSDKEVILAQSEWIEEVPRVLGSYMVEREISNVYNSVVVDGKNLRKSIDLSTKRINRETLRKLEEFGYYYDGEMIQPYPMPNTGKDSE